MGKKLNKLDTSKSKSVDKFGWMLERKYADPKFFQSWKAGQAWLLQSLEPYQGMDGYDLLRDDIEQWSPDKTGTATGRIEGAAFSAALVERAVL